MRPLHPRNARSQRDSRVSRCGRRARMRPRLRKIQRHPSIARQMVLRSVAASVKIEGERGGAFFEGLPQKVNPADDKRQTFRNSFTAASFCAGLVQIHFSTGSPGGYLEAPPGVARSQSSRALRQAMSARIALLGGRIEKRKRARTGNPSPEIARGCCPFPHPPLCQIMDYFFFFLPTEVSCPPLIAFNPSSASLQSLPVAFSAPVSIHF